jgi:acyl-CoA reductase-like NAD-dependent aldehyde dehydrogenase
VSERLAVRSPYDRSLVAEVDWATPEQVEAVVAAAAGSRAAVAAAPAHLRAAALDHVSARLAERADEVARLITSESGKPLVWSRTEVARAVWTFRWGAEEARRFSGELQRLDTDPAATGRIALVRRFPRPGPGDLAVQLPAQPGRPQARSGGRGRRSDRAQAGPQDASLGDAAR